MAIAERTLAGSTAASAGSNVTLLSVSPTGMQDGDWLIFYALSVGGNISHSNTAGGLSRAHAADFVQGSTTVVSTWKKKCGPSEAGPYTITLSATNRMVLACRCYSGGDATDIVELAEVFTGASAQSLGITTVTPADVDRWHLLLEGSNSVGGGSVVFTQPTNYTEIFDFASTHGTSANACMGWAERALPDASATGTQTFSISGGANRQIAGGSILLKPAAGGTTFTQSLAGAITPAGAVAKQPLKSPTGATAPTGSATRLVGRPLTGSASPTGGLTRRLAMTLAGLVTPAGTLATVRLRILAVTGALAPSGGLARQAGKPIAAAVIPAGTLARQTGKRPAGQATPAGSLTLIRTRLLALAGALTPTAALVRRTGKAAAGTTGPTGGLARQVQRRPAGSVTPGGALAATRSVLLTLAGLIAPGATLRRSTAKSTTGAVAPTGAATKRLSTRLTGSATPGGGLLRLLGRLLGGTATPIAQVQTTVMTVPTVTSGSMAPADRPVARLAPADRPSPRMDPADRQVPTMTGGG